MMKKDGRRTGLSSDHRGEAVKTCPDHGRTVVEQGENATGFECGAVSAEISKSSIVGGGRKRWRFVRRRGHQTGESEKSRNETATHLPTYSER